MEGNLPCLGLADPVSALTHLLAVPIALWATARLWVSTSGVPHRRASVLVFGLSSFLLFLASGAYHAAFEPLKSSLRRWDHAAIYVLIAGTFTPVVAHLTRGWLRAGVLVTIWTLAALGVALKLVAFGALPEWVDTTLYLAMGWLGLIPAVPFARARLFGVLRWMALGGACYTAGALCELLRWPTLVPGIVGPHEVFHVAVLCGSAAFLSLIVRHVAQGPRPAPQSSTPSSMRNP